MMSVLRTQVHDGDLTELVGQVLGGDQAFGWCHTHEGLRVVLWDGSQLLTALGTLDQERTWSARIGGRGRELRWTRTMEGGAATEVRLIDDPAPGDTAIVAAIELQRIVWGAVVAIRDGWAELQETRTAPLHLPAPDGVVVGDRLGIATRELVVETEGVHDDGVTDAGNRVVIEELLEAVVRVQDEGGQ